MYFGILKEILIQNRKKGNEKTRSFYLLIVLGKHCNQCATVITDIHWHCHGSSYALIMYDMSVPFKSCADKTMKRQRKILFPRASSKTFNQIFISVYMYFDYWSLAYRAIIFSSPWQRQCELLSSLGICRLSSVDFSHFNLRNQPIRNKNCLWWPCL
jgi:hypothetical protein